MQTRLLVVAVVLAATLCIGVALAAGGSKNDASSVRLMHFRDLNLDCEEATLSNLPYLPRGRTARALSCFNEVGVLGTGKQIFITKSRIYVTTDGKDGKLLYITRR
jgi:hypothetical protein